MLIASRPENANIFIVFCSSSTPYATITHFWLQMLCWATSSMAAGMLLEKRRAGIAIATVGEDNYNHAAVQRAAQFHGSPQGCTAGDADTDAFLSIDFASNTKGGGVFGHPQRYVQVVEAEDARCISCHVAQALDLASRDRLDPDNLHLWRLPVHEGGQSGQCPTCTHARDHVRHIRNISQYLGAGCLLVGTWVGAVFKLVEVDPCRLLRKHLLYSLDGQVRATRCVGENDIRTKHLHDLSPLDARALGHHRTEPVTTQNRNHCHGNPGIPAGGFQQLSSGLQHPSLLGVPEHRKDGAVLEGSSGVVTLQLCQDSNPGICAEVLKLDDRRVADEVQDGVCCHVLSPLVPREVR